MYNIKYTLIYGNGSKQDPTLWSILLFLKSLFQAQAVSGHEKCYSFNFQLSCRREVARVRKLQKAASTFRRFFSPVFNIFTTDGHFQTFAVSTKWPLKPGWCCFGCCWLLLLLLLQQLSIDIRGFLLLFLGEESSALVHSCTLAHWTESVISS